MIDKEAFTDELRDVADRIEDGEYETTSVSIQKPAPDNPGRVAVELYTIEDWRRVCEQYEHTKND